MKKQKTNYLFVKYEGPVLQAKREISYEIKLSSRLILDVLCFRWNKEQLTSAINRSIDSGDKESFLKLSEKYKHFMNE